MKKNRGNTEQLQIQAFLTSVLDGGELSTSRSIRYTPGGKTSAPSE